jgi:hypothetical protein
VFHVNPFLHAAGIDLVTTGTWYSAHKVACLVMITLPGEALSLGRKTRGPSSDLVAQWCCISLRAAQWWYGFLPRPARSRAVSFLSGSGSNSNSTPFSLWVGRPPHAMQCQHCARCRISTRGGEGAIWHLSHCLEQCRDYGMREKHMGISARLNSFFWASMGVLGMRCTCMQLYKYIHGWLAAATHYWRPNEKPCNILTLQFFGRRRNSPLTSRSTRGPVGRTASGGPTGMNERIETVNVIRQFLILQTI